MRANTERRLDTSVPGKVEENLRLFQVAKYGHAGVGVFSVRALGTGIVSLMIPRILRAKEAGQIQALFAAARCHVAGHATEKQEVMLTTFLTAVKDKALTTERNLETSVQSELGGSGMVSLYARGLAAQRKYNEVIRNETFNVDVVAGLLTVANMVSPKGLDEMAIFASGDLTAPSMMDGFLSSGYIYDLNDYVCEKIARPASSFFLKDNEAPMSELEYAINDKLKDDAESKNIRDGALSREPVVNQTATKDYKHVLEELKADQQQSSSTPNSRI